MNSEYLNELQTSFSVSSEHGSFRLLSAQVTLAPLAMRLVLAGLVAALSVAGADSILVLGSAAAAGTGISLGLGGATGGIASGLAAIGLLGNPLVGSWPLPLRCQETDLLSAITPHYGL